MRKMNLNLPDTDRMVVFTEKAPAELQGKKLPIHVPKGDFYIRFDAKVDLAEQTILDNGAEGYDESKLPTLGDLAKQGIIKDWQPFKEINFRDVLESYSYSIDGKPNFKAIKDACKDAGIKVTISALEFVYHAWKVGFKVGYVDNQCHIYCPRGSLNPLSYSITELHPLASDWQTTYIC